MSKKKRKNASAEVIDILVPDIIAPEVSRLEPQVKQWEEDLPEQNQEHPTDPLLIRVNEINDVWMEIPRYENIEWLGVWFLCITSFITPIFFIYIDVSSLGFEGISELLSHFNIFMLVLISMTLFFFRMAIFAPRGTPVRFNRTRQKVYVYEHQRSNWNPWKRWPTVIKVFDWADIHGEIIRRAGRYDQGYRLSCAVCEPGTYQVVDRFILCWTVGDIRAIRGLWSHCCQYKQGKTVPDTPLLTRPPLSWCPRNNIHWPEAVDKESRSEP